jgi:beta-barrel assembly-enhancing protease
MNIISIGRANSNQIIIDDKSVSAIHAQLIIDDNGKLFICDLNSKNGTFINNVQINERHVLNIDDQVRLGNFNFNWMEALVGDVDVQPEESINTSTKSKWPPLFWRITVLLLFLTLVSYFVFFKKNGIIITNKNSNKDSTQSEEPRQNGTKVLVESSKKDSINVLNPLKRRKRSYDLTCLNEGNGADDIINLGRDLQDDAISSNTKPFSVADEMKIGKEAYNQALQKYKFVNDLKIRAKIEGIFKKLLNILGKQSKGFIYKIYVIKSTEINAFTVGGRVFVTTGIIDFAKTEDELACILGHEIYHNELGHINWALRKEAFYKHIFGNELGQFAALANNILTTSFNQKDETNCDFHGLDLAIDAGYDGCAIIQFWNRMSQKESEIEVGKFFRSHPYSKQRTYCIGNHIKNNYNHICN